MPKKYMSAYNLFMVDEAEKIKKNSDIKQKEVFTAAAANWKNLDAKRKEEYEKISAKDKQRYEQELNQIHEHGFFMVDGVKSCDILVNDKGKRIKEKFPGYKGVEPKRPTTAYFFFSVPKSQELREKDKMKLTESTKAASELWKKMSEIEKEPFVKQAEEDQERYNRQVAEIASQGYFLLPDGKTKSSDMEKKVKKKRKPAGESPSRKSAKGKTK